MPSDLELVRQLGELEADANRLSINLELMRRDADAAPTQAQMDALAAQGKRFMFHRTSREKLRRSIARMTAIVAELFVLINDLRARYYPESQAWTRPPSQEMIRALQDSTLERQVKADREKQLNASVTAVARMKERKDQRKRQVSGFAALLNAIA